MCTLHFVFIIAVIVFANCEVSENGVIEIPVRVFHVPPNNIEFQFEKNCQIDPISMRTGNDKFYLFESENTKNFRNPKPLQKDDDTEIKITLEYRFTDDQEIKERTFQHEIRNNPEEVIIVRFPLSAIQIVPQEKTCTSQNCENADSQLPENMPKEEVDAPTKPIEESHTETFIDEETIEESCESDYGYTEELLNTALRHGKIERHLLLKGLKNTAANPVDTIRDIIFQTLDLPHLEYNILQAKYVDENLLFEMKTPKDVVEILNQARAILEKQKDGLKIVLTSNKILESTPYSVDVRIDAQ